MKWIKIKGVKVYKNDHRRIAEIYFNKKLEEDECVHHLDGNHFNNDPENLVIIKKTQHGKVTGLLNTGSKDTRNMARRLKRKHPEWTSEEIARKLGCHPCTVRYHISNREQKYSEIELVIKLRAFGLTQKEISNHPEITFARSTVGLIIQKFMRKGGESAKWRKEYERRIPESRFS